MINPHSDLAKALKSIANRLENEANSIEQESKVSEKKWEETHEFVFYVEAFVRISEATTLKRISLAMLDEILGEISK